MFEITHESMHPVAEYSDEQDRNLLREINQGSHRAFAELVTRHSTRFYRVAYRYTAQRAEAEDIVQTAFLKLWENPSAWDEKRGVKFTTWFYRIVVNLCLDWQKKKSPFPLLEDFDYQDDRESQETTLLRTQEQQLLEMAIAALPERQRTALNLCIYEELSNKEAAEVMGVKLKALQSLIVRAKETLKKKLDAHTQDKTNA